jgi:tetrahydromethanopterin S-methyltransferase subunit G
MKTIYLLYISAGVALATIFYLYKSHKETMKKIDTIQNLVSSIQQVPVMKYNDTEIQSTIKTRCDEIEELIHFVNDEINTKLDNTISHINDNLKSSVNKQNNNKTNIPKTFFSDYIQPKELSNTNINVNNKNNNSEQDISNSRHSTNSQNNIIDNMHDSPVFCDHEENDIVEDKFKRYPSEPILDIENYKDNEFTGISLSSLDKATLDGDSVHNSSTRIDKNILGEVNLENNEDLNETYDLTNKMNMDIDIVLNNNLENASSKSLSNNNKQKEYSNNHLNTSNNHSVSDNSKIPKLNELKQIAKSRDLSTSGNKKEIYQRLLDNGYNF